MIEGVDYAFARPEPAALARAGKRFAGRYVGLGSTGKRLSLAEAQALTRAGLSIVSLAELSERSALSGHRRGAEHAVAALAEAGDCGMPTGWPIYFAVDFDASAEELLTVRGYFEGVATVLPHRQIGAYGGYRTIRWLFDHGLIAWGFQTYAWSAGRWDPRAHIQQYRNHVAVAGSTVDLCRATQETFGQWRVGGPAAPGEDDDMPSAEELWTADLIPVKGDPENPTWQARNAIGTVVDLTYQARDSLNAIRSALADPPQATVTLTDADREVIVQEVTDAVVARIGLIPTAEEVARLTADKIYARMKE